MTNDKQCEEGFEVMCELNKLNTKQRRQLLWISIVREIPNFICILGIDTRNRNRIGSYINLLGVNLGMTYRHIIDGTYKDPLKSRDIEYVENMLNSFVESDYKLYFTKFAGLYIKALNHIRTNEVIDSIVLMSITKRIPKKQIIDDIKCIYNDDWDNLCTDMYFENSCVDNFRKRMYEMGIGYWGRWFENIHNTNFIPEVDWVEHVTTMPVELILGDVLTAIKWLEELEIRGARYLNEARIILLGEKGAGKTSLARRLVDPNAKMPDERESTEGVDITALKIRDICPEISEDKNANVHIWDFAGHSITHAVHRCFLSERCIYIIVYDGRTEGRNRLDYWLNHVRDYGGDSKVYILANIKDKNKPELEENYIKRHYEKHRCEFIYFSIKDDAELLYQFRIQLAIYISIDPAWGQNIPVNYFYTKEKLKEAFGNDRDYISIAEFKNVSFGGNQNMLRALHSLGICLYYEEIDALNTLILNPKWITWGGISYYRLAEKY